MRLLARLAWFWLIACNGHDVLVPSRSPAQALPPPIGGPAVSAPITAPHGGEIELVAVTDGGDAALSSDSFAGIRLWPTLDGTHEPVVVHGPEPMQLALGRDREGLFAAILDEVGDVKLLQFDGNGGVLGRAQLAGQPAIAQVVAIPGGVLVRRADHSIERFDTRGVATGRLVPAAGQRVVSLAVRRDRALAGIAEGDEPRAQRVRWIVLDRSLRWGASIALPEPLANLAVAPGGHRLAGAAHDTLGNTEVGRILELAPQPRVVGTVMFTSAQMVSLQDPRPRPAAIEPPSIGFVDDDTAVASASGQLEWVSADGAKPWGVDASSYAPEGELAVGDRAVGGRGAALQLVERGVDHFLGYHFLGKGFASESSSFHDGGGLLLDVEAGNVWLDSRLRAQPATLDPELSDLALVLDEHHLLFKTTGSERPFATRLVVRDLTAHADTEIARVKDASVAQYDAGTHVLAVAAGDNIVRYRLAFAPVAATPLRTLSHAGELHPFHLTDPAHAGGVVAVVDVTTEPRHALVYRIDGDDRGPPIAPQELSLAGPVAAVDRAGVIYAELPKGVQVYRNGHPAEQLALAGVHAVSHDGMLLASGYANEVIVFDARGAERWRRPVWKAGPVAWSVDDRTLFVAADGGATMSFDARTGERLAIQCGWGFGLYDGDVRGITASTGTPSACVTP